MMGQQPAGYGRRHGAQALSQQPVEQPTAPEMPPEVINYTPSRGAQPERNAARPRTLVSGASRRNRLAKRYEAIHLDGDNFDIPTYLRHSAD